MRRCFLWLCVLLAALPAAAQFTSVTGTVTDPNGIPYAYGTISATIISSGTPTLNGFPYTPPSQPAGLNSLGSFVMQLADNTVLQPGGSQWKFTVCSGAGTVNPAIGKGSVCFTAGPITISGFSQSISATLNAAALALTVPIGGGGGVSSITGDGTLITNSSSVGAVVLTLGNAPATSVWGNTAGGSGAPAYTANPVVNGLSLAGITGATQCLHVNASGLVSGTGSDCGAGGGVTGSGTPGHVSYWTGATALGDSPITTDGSTFVTLGTGLAPLTITGNAVSERSAPAGTCAGTNAIPGPTVGCSSFLSLDLPATSSASAITSGVTALQKNNTGTAVALQMAGYFSSQNQGGAITESRGLYAESYQTTGAAPTTNRGIFGFAANTGGGTSTTNEAGVFQSGASAGTNTNDYGVHILTPVAGGTLTNHAGLKIETQGTGTAITTGSDPTVLGSLTSGGTNCVQASSTGQLSITGSPCGAGGGLPSGIQAQPLVNTTGATTYATSALFWDASQFTGATADVKLNTANAYAITNNGGTIDARALGGAQTIASEVSISQLRPPVLTSPAGTSPGAGTYKLVYTLTSPAATETSASMESSITITGAQSIQVAAPSFPGSATTYSVYMTAAGGASWTEVKCAGATGVAIGSPVTITATCGGGAVSKSNNGFGVSLIPPKTGIWTVTIADSVANTSCGLKFFDNASYEGQSAGEGRSFWLTSNASTNVEALECTDNNPKQTAIYVRIDGIAARGTGSDHIQTATCLFRNVFDVSRSTNMQCGANQAAYPVSKFYGTLSTGTGAATQVSGNFEANSVSEPMVIGTSASATTIGWDFNNISAVHPGNTLPNIEILGGVRSVHFSGITYLEGPSAGACASPIQISTLASMPGPVVFDNVHHGAGCSGTTSYLISVPNAFTLGQLNVLSVFTGNFTNLFNYNPTSYTVAGVGTATTYPNLVFDKNNPSTVATGLNVTGAVNSATGFQVNALAPLGAVLSGNGTNGVFQQPGIAASTPAGTTVTINGDGVNSNRGGVVYINNSSTVTVNIQGPANTGFQSNYWTTVCNINSGMGVITVTGGGSIVNGYSEVPPGSTAVPSCAKIVTDVDGTDYDVLLQSNNYANRLTSDYTNATTSYTSLLSFPIAANTKVSWQCAGGYKVTGTFQAIFAVNFSQAPTNAAIAGNANTGDVGGAGHQESNGQGVSGITTASDNIATQPTNTASAAGTFPFIISGVDENGGTAGVITIEAKSNNVSGTVTVKKDNLWCVWQFLN